MKNWRTEKALYQITEVSRRKVETYPMYATGDEIKSFLESKRMAHGYVPGLGGDATYDCFAILAQ